MTHFIEPRRNYVKRYEFLSFGRDLSNKYGTHLLDAATKTGLDNLKNPNKKLAHKAAGATGEFTGNKTLPKKF